MAPIVGVVERLIAHGDERVADGITLGQLYASLRDPGRNHLRDLHEEHDAAVFVLYGFSAEDDLLAQLLALNESVALEDEGGLTSPRGRGTSGSLTRSARRVASKRRDEYFRTAYPQLMHSALFFTGACVIWSPGQTLRCPHWESVPPSGTTALLRPESRI